MRKRGEPQRLKRGKSFHKAVQRDWQQHAEGQVGVEQSIVKPTGQSGRVDILVDAGDRLMAVVELKASRWDNMSPQAVRRNVRRQAAQIWNYIESQLEADKEVSPGVIFPHRPKSISRLRLVEELFEQRGIAVVWQDETTGERKARSQAAIPRMALSKF